MRLRSLTRPHPSAVARTRPRRAATRLSAAAVALALAACGAPPPQAPLPDANLLDSGTSGISTACGKAYLLEAFGGSHAPGLAGLEGAASASAAKLLLVEHRNPTWIYQGTTVRQLIRESASMLGSCGLTRARTRLLRAGRQH